MAKILLIESDRVLAKHISHTLTAGGHSVAWALDPQTAISLADDTAPELVLTDLLLAGRSGVEFIYEFVSYPEWAGVPFILLSSVPEAEVNIDGSGLAEINVKKFIYKPHSSLKQIAGAVDYALGVTVA